MIKSGRLIRWDNDMKKSELIEIIREEIQNVLEEKKATKATIKSMMKKLKVPESDYELDSDTVTMWYDLDNSNKVEKVMKALHKVLGSGKLSNNGSKFWLQYKGKSVDMGDWNDATSRWHY